MNLSDINRGVKKHKKPKRLGRGPGSGQGKTAGRGHKGQGQLAGWAAPAIFEGGRQPLIRRMPKRGFHNAFARSERTVNVGDLNTWFETGEEVSIATLKAKGRVRGAYEVLKILGHGDLTKKLKIVAHKFSKSAVEKVQGAGGEVVVLPGVAPVTRNKMGHKAAARKK